ncbi:protein of unknown function [Rhizobium mongolense subsp. loessense]|uniref:DUF4174 domain-containing protein n=1 Tax=Rhizobium mongolense subsp. loessense TaxID=158890 RepID=A0A1G4RDI8_9HYPH|nr:DUF4174 domain-containing protein [Rhizobium mongolense]SCW54983.1 protein of unknown function [Rhizobium mongolense subsp. loessense]
MLKSIIREIMGPAPRAPVSPDCLKPFIGTKRVLIIFADADDDRATVQDELLRTSHLRFIEDDIEVFSIAGGGVFPLFEGSYDLDADEIRDDLEGPQPGEFGLVLLDRDGTVKLRSSEPVRPEEIIGALSSMPH